MVSRVESTLLGLLDHGEDRVSFRINDDFIFVDHFFGGVVALLGGSFEKGLLSDLEIPGERVLELEWLVASHNALEPSLGSNDLRL